jgi:hypothetical protein
MRLINSLAIGLLSVLGSGSALGRTPAAIAAAPPPAAPAAPAPPAAQQPATAQPPAPTSSEASTSSEAMSPSPSGPSSVHNGLSAGLLLGYGFSGDTGIPYTLGLGARVGYTLPFNLYVGGSFVYHLGKTKDYGPDFSEKRNVWYVSGEVGYDIGAGPVVIRPYAGVGRASVDSSSDEAGFGSYSSSRSKLILYPGTAVMFPIGPAFVGADLRYVIMIDAPTSGTGNAFTAFLTGGVNF